MRLSAEQRRIVTAPVAGHMLVRAAPGSGKTHAVVARVGHLLASGAAEPEQILAMTFTRKAADELRQRLGQADVWAGTFHAVAVDLLQAHGAAVGWGPPFRIFDERRAGEALERAAALAGLGLEREDRRRGRALAELRRRISDRKRSGRDEVGATAGDELSDELVAAVDAAYRGLLAEARALDFDDLIVRAVEALRDDDVAEQVRRRVRFVLVDEFHDVSPEQYELVRLIAPPRAPGRQVVAVADPDQAIFGWRGADAPQLLDRFVRDYRPRAYRLSVNYRSTPNIVRAASAVLAMEPRPGEIVASVEADHLVACLEYPDGEREADGLARLIERALASGRYEYGDVAILYRTHVRADAAERALLERGIPVWRVQPDRFFDRPEVHEALRYLELVLALHDDCFEPALNWPRVLVDELTMVHLRRLAAGDGLTLCELAQRIELYADRVSPLTRFAVKQFLGTIDAALAPLVDRPVDEVVERLLALLAARRSPIPRAERETLRGLQEFLAGPLAPAAERLAEAVAAGRPVVIHHGADADASAAAAILAHVLGDYLDHPAVVGEDGPPGAFVVALGEERPAGADGFGLGVRRTRDYAYSLSTLAWRLGQMVLMRFERLGEGRFVLFDLETGSRHPNLAEIVDVAALPVQGGGEAGEAFSSLVRPSGPEAISAEATRVHGLRWAALRGVPPAGDVLPRLLAFLEGGVLVGHNIEDFDCPVLRRAAVRAGLPAPAHPLVDTYKMARRLLPEAPSHRLEELARRVEPRARQQHRALPDARLNALVFRHLLEVQRAEQELDALGEALPLVAIGIEAAGVPLRDENATLALAGARAAALGQGGDLLARWRSLAGADAAAALEGWLATRPRTVPEDDHAWDQLAERWREVAAAYCASAADRGLPAFLRYAALATPVDYQPEATAMTPGAGLADPRTVPASERVAMMTIYAAKGKEWPLVFLLGAEDDQFPFWRSDDPEECRRVLYVGMTRAKRRLLILWSHRVGDRAHDLSPFLRALSGEVIERRS